MSIAKFLREVDPRTLTPLELNARFFRHETFMRLVENIRRDGALLGNTPFIWRIHDDATQQPSEPPAYLILSGNHRVKAAIAAELPTITVEGTDDYLPPDRRAAIQTSQNAISGEDDPATLKLIYEGINDPDMRLYSGLDDKTLSLLSEVNIGSLGEAHLNFQTITFTFLPHELEAIAETMTTARKQAKAVAHYANRFDQYDAALDALEEAGSAYNIRNAATALALVLDIYARHREDLTEGYLNAEGIPPNPKQRVPLLSAFNHDHIPAALAAKLRKALAKNTPQGKSALEALDAILDKALAHEPSAKT
jgi:hypothetical protein